jgi:hypothetical protein
MTVILLIFITKIINKLCKYYEVELSLLFIFSRESMRQKATSKLVFTNDEDVKAKI